MYKFLFISFGLMPTFIFAQKDSLGDQRQNRIDFQVSIKKAVTIPCSTLLLGLVTNKIQVSLGTITFLQKPVE